MQTEPIYRLSPAEMRCIDEAAHYIDKHHSDKISADQLSEEFKISKTKLQLGFQRRYSMTVYKYIQYVRIRKAKEMLIDTDKPVKAIADASGFPNESHFCKLFKKLTAISPAVYRCQQAV